MGKGFTLVELAIVLVIIGLLVGGVLAGQELIHISKRSAAVRQVNEYLTAIAAYQTKYSQLPGDDKRAASFLSGATSGNGDGYIYSTDANTAPPPVDCLSSAVKSNVSIPTEVTSFWHHLSLAGLVGFSPIDGTNLLRDTMPAYKIALQTHIISTCIMSQEVWGVTNWGPVIRTGNIFILGAGAGTLNNATNGSRIKYLVQSPLGTQVEMLPAEDQYYIDQKLDDGIPNKGVAKVLYGCNFNQASYSISNPACTSILSYKWGKI